MSASSIVERITAAAVAALAVPSIPPSVTLPAGATLPSGLTVNRYRTLPIDKAALPDLVVYPDVEAQIERIAPEWGPLSDRHFKLLVVCRAKVPNGQSVDVALDPLFVWAIQALFVDEKLGGLADGIQHLQSQWDAGQSDKVYGAVALHFLVRYQVLAVDPTVTGN